MVQAGASLSKQETPALAHTLPHNNRPFAPPADTNSLYWPWYCDSNTFWQHVLKALLTGVLPSILSTMWDT